jgi:hypothetical protein
MTPDNSSADQDAGEEISKQSLDLESKMKIKLDKSDFNEWYPNVIELANLSDKRYPVKGMNVWTPNWIEPVMERLTFHFLYPKPSLLKRRSISKVLTTRYTG